MHSRTKGVRRVVCKDLQHSKAVDADSHGKSVQVRMLKVQTDGCLVDMCTSRHWEWTRAETVDRNWVHWEQDTHDWPPCQGDRRKLDR